MEKAVSVPKVVKPVENKPEGDKKLNQIIKSAKKNLKKADHSKQWMKALDSHTENGKKPSKWQKQQ